MELRGDGTGRRHQVRRNLECPARDFPCDDEHDERQADFQNPDELRRDHLSHQVAGPGRRRSLGAPVETKACKGVPSLLWKALEQSYPSTNANYMFVFLTGTVKHGGVDQKSRVQIKQLLRSGRNEIEDLGGPWQFPAQGEFGQTYIQAWNDW